MKKRFFKILTVLMCVSAVVGAMVALSGCGSTKESVVLTGSTSVTPLMEKLAAEFNKTESDIEILITGVGSSQGIADAEKGACDIGMSSRALKESEKANLQETRICTDGIAIVVNPASALTNVTSDQVYNLYANNTPIGEITEPVNRTVGSGTCDGFIELIKNSEGKSLKEIPTLYGSVIDQTGAVISSIAGSSKKMGYISLGSLNNSVKALTLDGVAANEENIKNGSYGLQRPFVLVTKKGTTLSESAQKFMDFVLSAKGQEIVTAFGCIAI